MARPVVLIEISSQMIGEPETDVWCRTCQAPSAVIVDLAVIAMDFGHDLTTSDPLIRLVKMWACEECLTMFEMPDSPVLIDNRG